MKAIDEYDYVSVGDFHEGKAIVWKGNESFYINTNGKRIGE